MKPSRQANINETDKAARTVAGVRVDAEHGDSDAARHIRRGDRHNIPSHAPRVAQRRNAHVRAPLRVGEHLPQRHRSRAAGDGAARRREVDRRLDYAPRTGAEGRAGRLQSTGRKKKRQRCLMQAGSVASSSAPATSADSQSRSWELCKSLERP